MRRRRNKRRRRRRGGWAWQGFEGGDDEKTPIPVQVR